MDKSPIVFLQLPLTITVYYGPSFDLMETNRALLSRHFLLNDPYLALLSGKYHFIGSLRNQYSGQLQLSDLLVKKVSGLF